MDHERVSHFHAIVNIAGFFSAIYFCERCFKQYSTNSKHRCESKCLTCKSQNCPETDHLLSCRSCHMTCRSYDCFERHMMTTNRKDVNKGEIEISQCLEYWRCPTCKKVVNRFKRPVNLHNCDEWLCKSCKTWVTGNHKCYIFPEDPKKIVKKFIFFDFEATQDTIAQCAEGYLSEEDNIRCKNCFKTWCGQPRHVPNFVVPRTVCEACADEILTPYSVCEGCGNRCPECNTWDKETETFVNPPCPDTCGLREVIFQGDSTLEDFGNWLFSDLYRNTTVLAHNMKVSTLIVVLLRKIR